MPYNAKILQIMMSGPSDTDDLSKAAGNTISNWNSLHGSSRKILFNSVHWSRNVLAQAGQRPQEFINQDILSESDALVAIFRNRFGSDTGKYASGTLEEIEESIRMGKQTMVFFSKEDVPRDQITNNEIRKVEEFKRKYMSQGIYKEYSSMDNFKDQLRDQLDLWVNKLEKEGDKYFEVKKEIIPMIDDAHLKVLDLIKNNHGKVEFYRSSEGDTISLGHKLIYDQFSNLEEFAKMKSRIQELVADGYLEKISENRYDLTGKGYGILDERIV